MIRAVIFDFFGVMTTDPTKALRSSVNVEAAQAISEAAHESDLGLINHTQLIQRLAEVSGKPEAKVRAHFEQDLHLDQEIMDLIISLHSWYRTGLLSNAGHTSLNPYIGQDELKQVFDTVVISADVGLVKPDSDIYRLVCRRLEVEPSEAVFIDDVERYVDGARAVGMKAILYQGFEPLQQELTKLLGGN